MKTVYLFGKEVPVKDVSCSLNGGSSFTIDPYFNLYVRMTDNCQANCSFCAYHSQNNKKFFVTGLHRVLEDLYDQDVCLNKIDFTGGEPSFDLKTLKNSIDLARCYYPEIYITINTNGFRFKEIMNLDINCVSLSRHHYNDKINEEIFKTDKVPSSKEIAEYCEDEKLHLRCNLIKGYIDSQEEMITYLEKGSLLGVNDFGFVSLMPLNQYCKDMYIDHPDLCGIPHTKLNYSQSHNNGCNCRNFLHYTEQGKIVQLYSRNNNGYSGWENT